MLELKVNFLENNLIDNKFRKEILEVILTFLSCIIYDMIPFLFLGFSMEALKGMLLGKPIIDAINKTQ